MRTRRAWWCVALVIAVAIGWGAVAIGQQQASGQRGRPELAGGKREFSRNVARISAILLETTSGGQTIDACQAVSLKVILTNLTDRSITFPWNAKASDGSVLRSVTNYTLAPYELRAELVGYTTHAGENKVSATIDPANTLGERGTGLRDNTKTFSLTPTQPCLETKLLSGDEAKAAGAEFPVNPERNGTREVPTVCNDKSWHMTNDEGVTLFNASPSAYFRLACTVTGAKADPEAFKNFRLKNGWKVDSVEWDETLAEGRGGYNRIAQPGIGTDNPYTKIHVWGDARVVYGVAVYIYIKGPKGTSPYRATSPEPVPAPRPAR